MPDPALYLFVQNRQSTVSGKRRPCAPYKPAPNRSAGPSPIKKSTIWGYSQTLLRLGARLQRGGGVRIPALAAAAAPGAQQRQAHLPAVVQVGVEAHRPAACAPTWDVSLACFYLAGPLIIVTTSLTLSAPAHRLCAHMACVLGMLTLAHAL